MAPEIQQKDGEDAFATPRRFKRLKLILFLGAIGFICIVILGVISRSFTTNRFQKVADAAAQFNVQVVYPEKSPSSVDLQLPGQTHAYYEAPIFAQTTGYTHNDPYNAYARQVAPHARTHAWQSRDGVYGTAGQYIGSDPDPFIRDQLARDPSQGGARLER